MRQVIVSAAIAVALCASMGAQQNPNRHALTFTDKQQDLAQELRAINAEMNFLQATKIKLEGDFRALVAEREEWMKKVEAAHPGFKVSVDDQGYFLEQIAAKK